MRRRIFNSLAAVSLLLWFAVASLWVWDDLKQFDLHVNHWHAADEMHALHLGGTSSAGTLIVTFNHCHFPRSYFAQVRPSERAALRTTYPAGPHVSVVNGWNWAALLMNPHGHGFQADYGLYPQPGGWTSRYASVGFPHWLALAVLSVPPALWLRRFIKRRRIRQAGLCPRCGYDLRATPERCPECGYVVETQSSPAATA